MREVAALAGVSLKTVSRVINAEPAVSDEVRSRVVGAIQRLDYRHDHAASSLRRSDRKTSTIGVLLEDVANPFSSALHREIEDVALRRGVLVLAGSSDEDEAREQQLIAAFTSRRVDGLIIDKADAATVELLKLTEPPSALFTSQNLLTIGASRALHRLDLHHRIALVGFDDVLLGDLLEPGITVIAQDPSTMGRKAAEQLFRRIDGDQSASVHLVVPTRLITRGSGEIRQ